MLEDLIERVRRAENVIANRDWVSDSEGDMCYREVEKAKMALADFILSHADTFIAWERQHAAQTSAFDEEA